jgi:hypothetical protein
MEMNMNFPVQAAPVMRGQDRGRQMQPVHAAGLGVTQSDSAICQLICGQLSEPGKTICLKVCEGLLS